MKFLLAAEFYPPSVGGVQEVVRQIAEGLHRRGHDVTVVTTNMPERQSAIWNGVSIRSFDISGNLAIGMTGEVKHYQDFLRKECFDVFFVYAAQQWTFDAAWDVLPEMRARKLFVPCGYAGLWEAAYADYYRQLPDVLREFDVLVYHAEKYRDREFAVQHGLGEGIVIPNGADSEEFSVQRDPGFRTRLGIGAEDRLVMTVGSVNGAKGHLETAEAFEKLVSDEPLCLLLNGNSMPAPPRLGGAGSLLRRLAGFARSHGVCKTMQRVVEILLQRLGLRTGYGARLERCLTRISKQSGKTVRLCNLPRPELVQAYLNADLFVFASHIEYSPLVLYEACAAGLPFLSTPVGNAAEIATWTMAGEICDAYFDGSGRTRVEPAVLAAHMQRLLDDPSRLERLGTAGRAATTARFNWFRLVQQYEALFVSNVFVADKPECVPSAT